MINEFNLLNTLWFTFGSLLQQKNIVSPSSMSVRIISAVWWFFSFVLVSSYIANLTALLSIERLTIPINSVDELAAQRSIQFGALVNSSTMDFFRVTKKPHIITTLVSFIY